MKAFTAPGYLIANARVEVKVAYTGFLLVTAVGLATMFALEVGRIGLSPAGIATHYRGGDFGEQMRFARTLGEMVETTHFHAFTMGAVYLILAHLFVATMTPAWLRWSAITLPLAGLVGDLGVTWLVRYVSASFAGVLLACWVAQWLGLGVLIVVPLVQMWRPAPALEDEGEAWE